MKFAALLVVPSPAVFVAIGPCVETPTVGHAGLERPLTNRVHRHTTDADRQCSASATPSSHGTHCSLSYNTTLVALAKQTQRQHDKTSPEKSTRPELRSDLEVPRLVALVYYVERVVPIPGSGRAYKAIELPHLRLLGEQYKRFETRHDP